MISTRYGPAFILFAGIALIPTLIHTYAGFTIEDGFFSSEIDTSLAGLESEPSTRNASWVEKTFESSDWIERHYGKAEQDVLLLFVGRSYDPKRLYHHPELALLDGSNLEGLDTIRVAQIPEMPIHLLEGRQEGRHRLAAYALLQGNQFIENPYLFQLKSALFSLFRPREAMTLFFVYDAHSSSHTPIPEHRALRLLIEAVQSFMTQDPKI